MAILRQPAPEFAFAMTAAPQFDAPKFEVVGIGNAIVDIIANSTDEFLARNKLAKGSMRLIDAAEAERLYAAMGPAIETSGGSCANTMAGIAALGGKAGYIGRVRDDQLGAVFTHDMRSGGVKFDTPAATAGPPTARSMILVTPDAQRTMNTYLGACVELQPADVSEDLAAAAKVLYIEGYLWDQPAAKDACRKAIKAAHQAGREVALTLSDSFCVERWREEFRALVRDHVDILFANESEIMALYQARDFETAAAHAEQDCAIAALTRSEKGSLVLRGRNNKADGKSEMHHIAAIAIGKLVDTTGAGDLYAAGFLAEYCRSGDLKRAGQLGSLCAGEVISHFGPRPQQDLKALAKARLGTA
ncbi:MAG: adenosine kinase [Alphaproteobacteria bacterium]|nr:adenosine kinase [Alphaproteobacteria bacterium]